MHHAIVVNEEQYRGYTIKIYKDCTPALESPREYPVFGTFLTWEKDYLSPDDNPFATPSDFRKWAEENPPAIILPVYKHQYGGGGVCFQTKPFNGPWIWDSGQVGYIYANQEDVKEYTVGDLSKAETFLKKEVKTYSKWANSQVFGYVTYNPKGDTVDSCRGYIGKEGVKFAKKEAMEEVDYHCQEQIEEEERIESFFNLN